MAAWRRSIAWIEGVEVFVEKRRSKKYEASEGLL